MRIPFPPLQADEKGILPIRRIACSWLLGILLSPCHAGNTLLPWTSSHIILEAQENECYSDRYLIQQSPVSGNRLLSHGIRFYGRKEVPQKGGNAKIRETSSGNQQLQPHSKCSLSSLSGKGRGKGKNPQNPKSSVEKIQGQIICSQCGQFVPPAEYSRIQRQNEQLVQCLTCQEGTNGLKPINTPKAIPSVNTAIAQSNCNKNTKRQ